MALATSKASVALLIMRIMGTSTWRKNFLYFLIAANFLFCTLAVIFTFAQCRPSRALWDHTVKGKCWNPESQSGFSLFPGSFLAFTDICLAVIPITIVQKLQLSLKKKAGLSILLGMGIFNEVFVLIVAACIPTVRPLFLILLKRPSSEAFRHHKKSYHSHSGSSHRARNTKMFTPPNEWKVIDSGPPNETWFDDASESRTIPEYDNRIRQTIELDVTDPLSEQGPFESSAMCDWISATDPRPLAYSIDLKIQSWVNSKAQQKKINQELRLQGKILDAGLLLSGRGPIETCFEGVGGYLGAVTYGRDANYLEFHVGQSIQLAIQGGYKSISTLSIKSPLVQGSRDKQFYLAVEPLRAQQKKRPGATASNARLSQRELIDQLHKAVNSSDASANFKLPLSNENHAKPMRMGVQLERHEKIIAQDVKLQSSLNPPQGSLSGPVAVILGAVPKKMRGNGQGRLPCELEKAGLTAANSLVWPLDFGATNMLGSNDLSKTSAIYDGLKGLKCRFYEFMKSNHALWNTIQLAKDGQHSTVEALDGDVREWLHWKGFENKDDIDELIQVSGLPIGIALHVLMVVGGHMKLRIPPGTPFALWKQPDTSFQSGSTYSARLLESVADLAWSKIERRQDKLRGASAVPSAESQSSFESNEDAYGMLDDGSERERDLDAENENEMASDAELEGPVEDQDAANSNCSSPARRAPLNHSKPGGRGAVDEKELAKARDDDLTFEEIRSRFPQISAGWTHRFLHQEPRGHRESKQRGPGGGEGRVRSTGGTWMFGPDSHQKRGHGRKSCDTKSMALV
ncbi:MAG: hypothetical protein Q9210_003916 [Variospora velana]